MSEGAKKVEQKETILSSIEVSVFDLLLSRLQISNSLTEIYANRY